MKRGASAITVWLGLVSALAPAGEWQPAAGPLQTRWAKDVAPDRVHPEYPRPQMMRKKWQNLNGLWQLAFAREGDSPPFGKDLADQILVPFPVESALSGLMKPAERLWYRRTFSVPDSWKQGRVLLHFGAVDWEARVWLNGKKLGQHRGGYDAFTFDITDALRPARAQELIVGVWDPTDAGTQPRGKQVHKPGGIYYTPTTGIWQTVWLEPVPKAYIADLKIAADASGQLRVDVDVRGAAVLDQVVIELPIAQNKRLIGGVPARSVAQQPVVLSVRHPRLWSPEDPFLYELNIKLRNDQGTVKDQVASYCAFRSVGISKDEKGIPRLLLNGKQYFQVGPLDQGFWPDGLYTAPTDQALKYDIEVMKRLGFNMVRKHVKVEPERWYYWCDKLGLLVWQDMPSGDRSVGAGKGEIRRSPESVKQFEQELKRLIDGRSNHPCIILWVVFNEGWGQFDTERLTRWVKEHDPSRLVDCASGWNDMPVGDVHDIHDYPGPSAPRTEAKRAGVLGEFGGLGLGLDGHTWSKKTWGYRGTRDSDDLTRKYERLLRGVWRLKEEKGLSAAVYTQITDVETEANGLLTYDRAVIKVDVPRVAAANRGDFSRVPEPITVVHDSRHEGQRWRYTTERPSGDWFKSHFDDTTWKEGPGGFGTQGTPGAVVRTEWKTADIWLRREFTLPGAIPGDLLFTVHHDEDLEIYLNGVRAAAARGFTTDYEELPIRPEALAALRPGKNRLAVHCKQTTGGQYIDVGLLTLKKQR